MPNSFIDNRFPGMEMSPGSNLPKVTGLLHHHRRILECQDSILSATTERRSKSAWPINAGPGTVPP